MPSHSTAMRSLCAIALWGLLFGAHSSWAQSANQTAFATEAVKKTKRPKPDKGNGETVAERERRMQRECKGRPNAGACEGYAN